MITAKIIRHRHDYLHNMNGKLSDVKTEVHFKILFSTQFEQKAFENWVKDNGGSYEWDRVKDKVVKGSTLPEIDGYDFKGVCWCDIGTHYILNQRNLKWVSSIANGNGEIYTGE